MEISGVKVRLSISEPWESSRIIEGRTKQSHSEEDDHYLLIEDTLSKDIYLVTNRYIGDDPFQFIEGKMIIVAISIPKDQNFSFQDPGFLSNSTYFGIGSIELAK